MKRALLPSLILAGVTFAVVALISILRSWPASGFGKALFVAGLVVIGLGAMGFTGGTSQMSVFGGGSMGRGHEILAEAHARGSKGYAERQGQDRGGRASFAWTSLIAGALVAAAGGVLSRIQG